MGQFGVPSSSSLTSYWTGKQTPIYWSTNQCKKDIYGGILILGFRPNSLESTRFFSEETDPGFTIQKAPRTIPSTQSGCLLSCKRTVTSTEFTSGPTWIPWFFAAMAGWWLRFLPLWKIWVGQLGWWHSQYMENTSHGPVATTQMMCHGVSHAWLNMAENDLLTVDFCIERFSVFL